MGDPDNNKFGLTSIGQIAVQVRDVDRAIDFYRDILGMRFLFKSTPGLGFFDCDGVRLLLEAAAEPKFKNTVHHLLQGARPASCL